ncbi:serine/threonine-protein kinase RIO3-like isoform X3 [Amphibalanus amphitrite]|uniref:serine/threonine-protein kinase RIO3-like isoform X3 n=1 Tax=Amphibalanus amphitrite TaxID=1232801 RepID=UPI001C926391|nr:serine/threonine-protein kinase RIO3-like isoform X3 [Amphibalanus amphitrite]
MESWDCSGWIGVDVCSQVCSCLSSLKGGGYLQILEQFQEMASLSAWGSVKHAVTSLDDVMSEQLAMDLQKKEDELARATGGWEPVGGACAAEEPLTAAEQSDVSSDLLLAQLMQDQLDRESDTLLQIEERKANGGSKVSVSYRNYRLSHSYPVLEPDEEEEDYPDDYDASRDWDSFESREREDPQIPRCGYTMHKEKMVTKHDGRIAGRKNACKVMDLPPSVCTGDGGSFDMEINNGVLNGLRQHARNVAQRRHRVNDKEDRSTSGALDRHTRLMILKMVNSGVLEDVNGAISTGKEATVFHAWGGSMENEAEDIRQVEIPDECAIKVFKTTLNEFKTREKYIKSDIRFKDKISKQNPRKMVHLWAEKEMCNLKRLTNAGIRCPLPLVLKQHVLLMSFIGDRQRPAPKLKDVLLSEKQWRQAYRQVLEMTQTMYEKCHLVHADLSEYNILYHDGACWFIDVSQSVEPFHPEALTFLYRDCVNITNFFSGKGVATLSPEELFSHISGLPLTDQSDISLQLAELEKSEQPRRRGQHRAQEAALFLEGDDDGVDIPVATS